MLTLPVFAQSEDNNPSNSLAESTYSVYLPLVMREESASQDLINGNFESGAGVGWDESSTNGWPLVTNVFPRFVDPHGSSWAAWLGGDEWYDEVSIISQMVTIPPAANQLVFWYWIQADVGCGQSYAYVLVDSNPEWTEDICNSTNMTGWAQETVDLSAYAGQTVSLAFKASTIGDQGTLPLNQIFIDDVSLATP